jgi:hypothetical protein
MAYGLYYKCFTIVIYGNDYDRKKFYSACPVACTINVYNRKFYDRKLRLSLERNYDRNPSYG